MDSVSKNKFLNHKLLSKSNIAVGLALLMILGLLVSRGLCTIATMLFGLNGLWRINPKNWLKNKWWLLGVCWVAAYAITYFWSADHHSWHERFDTKLPFLFLPLAFGFLPRFNIRQLQTFTIGTALMILMGVGYSTWFFLSAPAYYVHEYNFSNILPTLVENDHICFSLSVALFTAWCVYVFPLLHGKAAKWFIGITIGVCSAFLHLLSAKSGLVAWYLMVLGWSIYVGLKKSKWLGLSMLVCFVLFVFLAFRYVPTFQQRISYVRYTYEVYKNGNITGDYSDMGRMISYDIAIKLIKKHPLTGVGAGDILEEMKKGYDKWYPQVKEEQRLFPHNQFLTIALGCGLLAVLIFIVWLIWPLIHLEKSRAGAFFLITWIMLLVPLLVEPFLEIQFGVFVYLFFLLWQKHMIGRQDDNLHTKEKV